jgi:hypothetical protein
MKAPAGTSCWCLVPSESRKNVRSRWAAACMRPAEVRSLQQLALSIWICTYIKGIDRHHLQVLLVAKDRPRTSVVDGAPKNPRACLPCTGHSHTVRRPDLRKVPGRLACTPTSAPPFNLPPIARWGCRCGVDDTAGHPPSETAKSLPTNVSQHLRDPRRLHTAPAELRRLLGIGPGSCRSLKLEGKGLPMAVEPGRRIGRTSGVIGCSGPRRPRVPIVAMDPASYARRS